MKLLDLVLLFERGKRRYHIVGDQNNGVLIGLDLEGRLFTYLEGQVLSRVNPEAFQRFSSRQEYVNPGGDGLWPAPEGSRLGYEYSTAGWRVPPGLCHARWQLQKKCANSALVAAEIDLINSEGRGLPCLFSRDIKFELHNSKLTLLVNECIEYLGREGLSQNLALLAPWSLCQFDCDEQSSLKLPACPASEIWDLYEPSSDSLRKQGPEEWTVSMKTDFRFQLGLSSLVPSLEFVNPTAGFSATRSASPLSPELKYIDIADQEPSNEPEGRAVCLSAYCDPSGFMEIEAAGGCPPRLEPGTKSSLEHKTEFVKF